MLKSFKPSFPAAFTLIATSLLSFAWGADSGTDPDKQQISTSPVSPLPSPTAETEEVKKAREQEAKEKAYNEAKKLRDESGPPDVELKLSFSQLNGAYYIEEGRNYILPFSLVTSTPNVNLQFATGKDIFVELKKPSEVFEEPRDNAVKSVVEAKASLHSANGGEVSFFGLHAGTAKFILTVPYITGDGKDPTKNGTRTRVITVKVEKKSKVKNLAFVRSSLDIMDDTTASQLFGFKASRQFFALRLTLRNELDRHAPLDKSGNPVSGETILVYSESLSIPVKLQQKYDNIRKVKDEQKVRDYKNWTAVTEPDISRLASYDELPPEYMANAIRNGYYYSYRPYASQMVATTTERRNSTTGREKIFKILNVFASSGSFLSAVDILKGSKTDTFFNHFGNSFVPSLRKVFPDTSEIHRQNISAFSMRDYEEIPFGSQITKVVFIPKAAITGVLEERQVRISEIDTNDLFLKVAILDKERIYSGAASTGR